MTKLPDMQQAVNEVDGVAAATMRWPEPEGPAFMRIEFDAGVDEGAVAERVLEVLRQAGGVDTRQLVEWPGSPAEGEPQPQPQPSAAREDRAPAEADVGDPAPGVGTASDPRGDAVPTNGHAVKETGHGAVSWAPEPPRGAPRPAEDPAATRTRVQDARTVLERVNLDRTREGSTVEVSLELEGQLSGGRASARGGEWPNARVAAEATLAAVHALLPQARLELWGVTTVEDHGPAPLACVWLRRLTDSGQQRATVGSAIIREEPAEAAVRATLDALNRWIPVLRGRVPDGDETTSRANPGG